MSVSRAAGWPSDGPTAAQLKEFFAQIESGRITKERLQSFLRPSAAESDQSTLNLPIEELDIGVRAYNALKRWGIETIGDLVEKTENELKYLPTVGKMSIEEIKEGLAERGLALRSEETPPTTPRPEPEWQLAFIKLFQVVKLIELKVVASGGQDPDIEVQLNRHIMELEAMVKSWRDDPDAY